MAPAPVGRTRDLDLAVKRARRAAEDAGELDLPVGEFVSPLSPAAQTVAQRWIDDGTLAGAIASVAASDPELA